MLQKIVGQNIKRIRKSLGYSREQLALQIDLDTSHLGSIERGEQNAMLLTLRRVAEGLGVRVCELFREEDPADPFHTLNRFILNKITVHVRLLETYDPLLLLGLFDSDILNKLTIQLIEEGANPPKAK